MKQKSCVLLLVVCTGERPKPYKSEHLRFAPIGWWNWPQFAFLKIYLDVYKSGKQWNVK